MNEFQKEVEKISARMKEQWSPTVRLVHLCEELGELADAFLASEGHKGTKGGKEDIEEAMGGIFFDLFCLCNDFEMDAEGLLAKEIPKFWKYASKKDQ